MSESNTVDSFRINIKVHSFECDPDVITETFGIRPTAVIRKDQVMGSVIANRSSWFGHFEEGVGNEAFGSALEHVLKFIEQQKDVIAELASTGGEIVLIISRTVGLQDGLLFDLTLEPFFLHACGLNSVGLQVQAFTP